MSHRSRYPSASRLHDLQARSHVGEVLVVDDDEAYRQMIRRLLEREEIKCHLAASAPEALTIVTEKFDIDVVLTDLVMAGGDGLSLMKDIRRQLSDRPWLQLILITGHASMESAIGAIQTAVAGYLMKPVNPMDLVGSVRNALRTAEEARITSLLAEGHSDPAKLVQVIATARELAGIPEKVDVQDRSQRILNHWLHSARAGQTAPHLLNSLLKLMSLRSEVFSDMEVDECTWLILLELADAAMGQRQVSVTSLTLASGAPTTTALRRIEQLREAGFVHRIADPLDKRRIHIELTIRGLERMQKFIRTVADTARTGDTDVRSGGPSTR
jgi:CheY-like chemotaxis protein